MRTLPFSLPGFAIQHVMVRPTGLTITAQAMPTTALCPSCQQMSHRLHSYYTRSPHDLPVSGQPVQLVLRVRRFCCLNPLCRRRTFVETLPDVVPRHARRTFRLGVILDAVAFTPSAQAGERLVKQMGMQVWREVRDKGYTGSASSVRPYLALLRQVPDHLQPTGTPRRKKVPAEQTLSSRRVIRLALTPPAHVTKEQQHEDAR